MIYKTKPIIIKTKEQIAGIKESCILAADALQYAGKIVQDSGIGIATDVLDTIIHTFIVNKGGTPAALNYMGFPKSTCISINEVICHGIPGERLIQDGDVVKIDIAVILDGYYGDNCATFIVGGKPTPEVQDLVDTTQKCLHLGIDEVRPGKRFGDIGAAIARYAQEKGYSVVYQYAGHGVGLEFHEPPYVPHISKAGTGEAFKPGMIFTIEPMLNMGSEEAKLDNEDKWTVRTADGKLSAQFEHTVLVTDSGVSILTLPSN